MTFRLLHSLAFGSVFALGLSITPLAFAQTVLGAHGPWVGAVAGKGKSKVCYMSADPEKMRGNYTRRGRSYVTVTHRPSDKARNEVGVVAGYTYKAGSEVEVDIDGKKFNLFTQNGSAWGQDATMDAALVKAMMRGRQMIVRGTSSRGTRTTDTYSLKGFTAAYKEISGACGVKIG